MTRQTDFWNPKPYDFEAIVADVDLSKLTPAHVYRASAHVRNRIIHATVWNSIEANHDKCDMLYFNLVGRSGRADVWDNRRKASAQ